MKKIIAIAAAALLFAGVNANAQIVINAGYAHAFEKTNIDAGNHNIYSSLDGAYAGANYYYSLDNVLDGLAILPGANLSFLAGRYALDTSIKAKEVALNIPVVASYSYEIKPDFRVVGTTGPMLQLGLSHKTTDTNGTSFDLYNKNNPQGHYRNRFNIYWGVAAAIEVSDMIRVEVGYDFGLLNLYGQVADGLDGSLRRSFLHIGVGYLLGR